MSLTQSRFTRRLVGPYMLSLEQRMTPDGLIVTGIDRDGIYREFRDPMTALAFANECQFFASQLPSNMHISP